MHSLISLIVTNMNEYRYIHENLNNAHVISAKVASCGLWFYVNIHMACDFASVLSQEVVLVLPSLPEDPDRSIILPSSDMEGEEESNSGPSLDPATLQVSFVPAIITIVPSVLHKYLIQLYH